MILRLDVPDSLSAPTSEIGGKAAGLARLVALGLPVPPAVVVPAAASGTLVESDLAAVRAAVGGPPYAVRSSGATEDSADRSAAGQYESVMGVGADDVAGAVRRVWESAGHDRARSYAGGRGGAMAVVIQREVASDRAGVAFSRDPLTGEDVVVVECVFGHGERLVSGLATPDRYRVEGEEIQARVAEKEGDRRLLRTLRDDEVRSLAALTRRAEAGLGYAVDVEFAIADRTIWLVQARPITALARSG
ncbi:MAG: PEP/pyruvate-binding domain-containing protein [Actinomycetota bacterium]